MNISIQSLLDDSLKPKEERKRSGKFSPSSFGRCFRYQIWNRQNMLPSNPPDNRTMRVFKAGQLFHDFVQNTLLNNYTSLQKEVKIENDDVLGFADLVNDDEVIDIKSQHSRAFWHMERSEDIKIDKYPNWLQVMWYANELKKKYARLVFVSKDDLCIQEFRLELDTYWVNELLNELGSLKILWDSKELPPAKPRCYNGKECSFCIYKTKCNDLTKEK